MAIDRIIEGAAQRVSDAFASAAPDTTALRRRLVEHAATCLTTVREGRSDDDWLSLADEGTVSFSPRTDDGQPLLVNGKTTTFWTTGDIATAVEAFHAAAARGEFDGQLASGGQPAISLKIEGEKPPSDADNGSLSTGGGRTFADEVETRFTEHGDIDDR